MQRTHNFDTCGNLAGSLQSTQAFRRGRDDFGQVLFEGQRFDLVEKSGLTCCIDTSTQSLYEGGVLLQGRVERGGNCEEV